MSIATATTNSSEAAKIIFEGADAAGFFKRHDGMYVNESVGFGNRAIRQMMLRQFAFMSRNLYFVSFFGRYLLGPEKEEEIIKVEDVVYGYIHKAIASMDNHIGQLEAVIKDAGITDVPMYSKMEISSVPVTTLGSRLYLNLLKKADHYYSLNALLWMNGDIENTDKFNNEKKIRKDLHKVLRQVATQFSIMFEKTKKKDVKVAELAGTHDEDKLLSEVIDESHSEKAQSVSTEIGAPSASANEDAPATAKKSKAKKATTGEVSVAA